MITLKLTAMALLVPFGWQISDAAAYSQPIEKIDVEQERGRTQSCFHILSDQPDFDKFVRKPRDHSKRFLAPIAPVDSTPWHHHRHNPAKACRLDLDLIETN